MSYPSEFTGKFTVEPAFTAEQVNILQKWASKYHERPPLPYYYCQWVPCEDGSGIEYTEDECSPYECVEWLVYLIENYIKHWGLTLSGAVTYEGEENSDQGTLYVHNNEVRDVPNQIVTPPNPFVSEPGPTPPPVYDDHMTEFLNELLENIPEEWDGDEAAEQIAIDYVRHLEAEVKRLGGTFYPWTEDEDDGK